jgi:hypothetical protein
LNDLRLYNIPKQTWHGVKETDNAENTEERRSPAPRYGHCAAAMDDNHLLVFGGKTDKNILLNDTWIYSLQENTWTEVLSVNHMGQRFIPSPRVHASMLSVRPFTIDLTPNAVNGFIVYLFGGTNEEENLGDLWRINPTNFLWERVISVGFAPSPRYGHSMVAIENQKTFMIIGGCTVSPLSEYEGQQLPADISIAQMSKKYQSLLDSQFVQLNRKLNGLSTTDYKIAEEKLFESWKTAKAMNYYHKKNNALHTNPLIDVYFYNLQDDSWEERKFPKVSGEIPKSRMYFGAQSIGNFLFVIGGCYPTSLMSKCVDENFPDINVFDLKTHTWTKPLPINSDQYYQQTLLIAEADLIRAQNHLQKEKLEGLSLGAPGGLTREVAIAQMMVNVCQWRKEQLEKKKREDFLQPNPTIAATFTAVRQRIVYIGGFTPGLSFRRDILALSVEHVFERERRLQEMYDAKLELDRKDAEAKAAMDNLISSFELRSRLLEEQRNREREIKEMTLADVSLLPFVLLFYFCNYFLFLFKTK